MSVYKKMLHHKKILDLFKKMRKIVKQHGGANGHVMANVDGGVNGHVMTNDLSQD